MEDVFWLGSSITTVLWRLAFTATPLASSFPALAAPAAPL